MIEDFAQRWDEIEPLLDRLLDVPGAERTEWLRLHGADEELSALVTKALDNAPRIDAFECDIARCLPARNQETLDSPPSVPGYRILRFVGAGGMASVFEAERALPGGTQIVALKLLRINVHDPDERRRFLREQSILARLQHPHIAQLLDAGFTETGTPFLALEFVTGSDLVVYCAERGLDAHARLALFIDVCAAVEHAHRNLIVHRDLKPRNVLVSADGCVKLVDFGIAKLLNGDGDETRTEARRLTRRYAAPEQLAGGAATTAIDVHALGVLLAELLGASRYRAVDREVPASGCTSPDAFVFDDASMRRKLGPDVHAIVRETTQADPIRRYASVAALREDIERHLQHRPLRVRTHTFAYYAITFAKRHVLAVTASAAAAAILAGALGVSLYEAHLAHRAALAASTQARVAEAEAQRADAVKSFLEGLFDSAAPGATASETAEELLARGRASAERDFATQPALRVEILALIGDLERRSGHPDRAWQPLERAAALANAQFGAKDRRTLHVEYLLAKDADELGHVRDAVARLQRALDAFHDDSDRGSQEEVRALAWLAGLDERIGASATAIDVGENGLALARRVLPNDSPALTEAVLNLGWIQIDAGHPENAEPLLREALARKRSELGERHAEVADVMAILSSALVRRGRYDESEQLLREALDVDASVYAHPHPHTGWHLNDLANVLALEGRFDEASAFYSKSIALDRALAPAASLNEAVSRGNLARIRYRQGEYAEAEFAFRDAIERKQRLLGTDYGDNGRGYDSACLAEILIARGRLTEARTLIDAALSDARHRHDTAHPDIAFALTVEAELKAALGEREGAAASARDAVATYAALSDLGSDKAIRTRLLFGKVLQSLGRDSEAKTQFEGALAAAGVISPRAAALMARAANDLALVDQHLGDHTTARQLHAEAELWYASVPAQQRAEHSEQIFARALAAKTSSSR
jgi:tetratricopeptide (TPR) repeat protein